MKHTKGFAHRNAVLLALSFFSIALSTLASNPKDPYPLDPNIDVIHYRFALDLSANNDLINGQAEISVRLSHPASAVVFDLISMHQETGMQVTKVSSNGQDLTYSHQTDKLAIQVPAFISSDTLVKLCVNYYGVPADGLIISESKYGKKCFFGDNWPDRARHWLPCVDHLSDKATVEFLVTAPDELEVVAVGYRKGHYPVGDQKSLTHYISTVALPTKVMVIGVADFAFETAGFAGDTPIETWVYTEDREKGSIDYKPAVQIVEYFSEKIGPFAFEKLANVQSKTIYGGMENSGAIFYYENSVSGNNRLHSLLAHEIAHQWFGDAVSEADWHHIWLSEGFATYMEAVCMTEYFNQGQLSDRMSSSRTRVTNYYQRNPKPVIDTSIVNLKRLLSTNSYQKGAWFLHMLRAELGDDIFWKGMRAYYAKYKNANALTADFRQVMENVSGMNLRSFFDQWLFQAGHPVIALHYNYLPDAQAININLTQFQEQHFTFALEVKLVGETKEQYKTLFIHPTDKIYQETFPCDFMVSDIIIDPNCQLLYAQNDQ